MLIFNAAGFGNPAEQVPLNGGRINSDNRLLGWPFWAQPFLPIVTIYALLILLLFFGELRRPNASQGSCSGTTVSCISSLLYVWSKFPFRFLVRFLFRLNIVVIIRIWLVAINLTLTFMLPAICHITNSCAGI